MTNSELLLKANANLPTIDITQEGKTKKYVMVKDRVKAFRQNFDGWSLRTMIESIDDTQVIFSARVYAADGELIATGYAHEVAGASDVNRTSHIENCETSAIGRALANLGIGIDDSYGSADEVVNAQNTQDSLDKPVSKENLKKLRQIMELNDVDEKKVCDYFHVDKLEQLTNEEWAKAVKKASADRHSLKD